MDYSKGIRRGFKHSIAGWTQGAASVLGRKPMWRREGEVEEKRWSDFDDPKFFL